MLRSDLYNYSDSYIVVKERIFIEFRDINYWANKMLTVKNNALLSHACQKSIRYS